MCPTAFFYQLIIVGIVLLAIYGYRRMLQSTKQNITTLSGLLEVPTVNSRFLNLSLEGFYKERKVVLFYLFLSHNNNFVNPSMEPRIVLKKEPFFCIDYPKITEHTHLKKGKVVYNCRRPFGIIEASNFSWGNIRVFSEEEFRDILEELTQAAQMVESK